MPEFAQRHRRAGLVAHRQHEQIAEIDAGRERNLQNDDGLLEVARSVQCANLETARRHDQFAVHVLDRHAEHLRLLTVDAKLDLVVGLFHVGAHVGDVGRGLQDLHDLVSHLAADLRRRAIELDHDRREHGRARRRLGDRQSGVRRRRDRRQKSADLGGDLVARALALVLLLELDRDIALPGLLTHEVVTDEAVEVERGGRADIGLIRDHFGHRLHHVAELMREVGGGE